jgi:hypothetical protein
VQHPVTGVLREFHFLCSHCLTPSIPVGDRP